MVTFPTLIEMSNFQTFIETKLDKGFGNAKLIWGMRNEV